MQPTIEPLMIHFIITCHTCSAMDTSYLSIIIQYKDNFTTKRVFIWNHIVSWCMTFIKSLCIQATVFPLITRPPFLIWILKMLNILKSLFYRSFFSSPYPPIRPDFFCIWQPILEFWYHQLLCQLKIGVRAIRGIMVSILVNWGHTFY